MLAGPLRVFPDLRFAWSSSTSVVEQPRQSPHDEFETANGSGRGINVYSKVSAVCDLYGGF
jgi:hypothetical protein